MDEVPVYLVLWAETEGNTLKFSYLRRNKRGKGKTTLTSCAWTIEEVDKEAAERWCKAVMEVAYAGKLELCIEWTGMAWQNFKPLRHLL